MSCQQHKRDRGIWIGSYVWVFVQARRVFVWPRCQAAVFCQSEWSNRLFFLIRRSSELCVVCGTACAFLSVQCKLPYVCARVCVFPGNSTLGCQSEFLSSIQAKVTSPRNSPLPNWPLHTEKERQAGMCTHTIHTLIHTSSHKYTFTSVSMQLCQTD